MVAARTVVLDAYEVARVRGHRQSSQDTQAAGDPAVAPWSRVRAS